MKPLFQPFRRSVASAARVVERRSPFVAAAAFAALSPGLVAAHTGEHPVSFVATIRHLLSEPDHLWPILAAVVVFVLLRRRSRRVGRIRVSERED
ncbi:MAG: hypothetical protein R3E48_08845 [Burkholderiaceae bacterium]